MKLVISEDEYFDMQDNDPHFRVRGVLMVNGQPQPVPDDCVGYYTGGIPVFVEWNNEKAKTKTHR